MSTTLDPASDSNMDQRTTNAASERLKQNFAACRVKFKWLGTSKTLSAVQKTQAAESFGADGESISAGKKLIDTKHEAYRALTSLKSQVTRFWKDNSLPYPESGIRLMKQSQIEAFNDQLEDFRAQLEANVRLFADQFYDIQQAARIRLGSLYDASDYPSSLEDEFAVDWDFPTVEPPDYLRRLHPDVYEQQARRVSERFEQAVELAEQAFTEEFSQLVEHLANRLAGDESGRPRIFRDTAVSNMADFFAKFRSLNISSSEQLDQLVVRCEQLMDGVEPRALRSDAALRRRLSTSLSTVQSSLDQMMVDRPRRNILRPASQNEAD